MSEPAPPVPPDDTGLPAAEAAGLSGAEAARLFTVLMGEIRTMAGRIAASESRRTLQPTALVNETYLRMFGGRPKSWNDQMHFMRSAACTMKHILVDHRKRPQRDQVPLEGGPALDGMVADMEARCGGDLLAVADALDLLAAEDKTHADYVTLRFFTGRTNLEASQILGISERTGERVWAFARAWLQARLRP
jgi:RNA polymerase sigma factor (TIGR02999 family)